MDLYDPTLAANQAVADINTVPPDFRWMYKQADNGGAFVFNGEEPSVKSAMSIIGLMKKTNGVIRQERDNARKEKIDLSPLEDYGHTPAEIAEAIAKQREELTAQVKSVDIEGIKAGVGKDWAKKLEAEKKKQDRLLKKINKGIDDSIVGAIAAAKAIPAAHKLLPPFLRPQIKVMEDGDDIVERVIDSDGKPRFGQNGYMTVDELVAEAKVNPDFAPFFQSDTPSGGGTKPGSTGAGAPTLPTQRSGANMTPEEKIAAGLPKRK